MFRSTRVAQGPLGQSISNDAAEPSQTRSRAHLRYRPDIDGLRAIAVVSVVLYHSALSFPGGYVGVDVFYVISGFLITKIIYDLVLAGNFSFVDFYDRRIRRLFPALFVMLLAVTAWSLFHLIWIDLRDYGRSLFSATTYISNIYFYITTGYFNEAAQTKPLLHTWSLAVEEQFYIVVPFVLFALIRLTPRRLHVAILGLISVLSFLLCIWLTHIDTPAAFYLLPTRAWELGLGGVVAIASPTLYRHRWLSEILTLSGLAAILYASFGFSDEIPFPGWHAAIPTLGTAVILSTAGRSGASVERLLSTRPFTFVGKISYSLYLWHWPVIVAFTYGGVGRTSRSTSVVCVTLSFVLAIISWRFVEYPFRKRYLLNSARSLFGAAVAASLVMVSIGLGAYIENGFPQRQSRQLRALFSPALLNAPSLHCRLAQGRVAADRLCVRGAEDAVPSFIFVGDSHAGALSTGLFKAARSHGLAGVQFTAQGFVPLPGRHPLTSRRSWISRGAPDLLPGFLAYLRRHPELRTVVMTAFWSHEATGKSYRNNVEIDVDKDYDGSGVAYNPIAFRHGLDRLVEAFPERKFILLDDVPAGNGMSIESYARVVYSGGSMSHPGMSRTVADAQRASYEPILQSVAATHSNVVYLPVLARLCGPAICPLFRPDGVPIFKDGDHLSRYGSEDLAPALGVLFDRMRTSSTHPSLPPARAAGSGITAH